MNTQDMTFQFFFELMIQHVICLFLMSLNLFLASKCILSLMGAGTPMAPSRTYDLLATIDRNL